MPLSCCCALNYVVHHFVTSEDNVFLLFFTADASKKFTAIIDTQPQESIGLMILLNDHHQAKYRGPQTANKHH